MTKNKFLKKYKKSSSGVLFLIEKKQVFKKKKKIFCMFQIERISNKLFKHIQVEPELYMLRIFSAIFRS